MQLTATVMILKTSIPSLKPVILNVPINGFKLVYLMCCHFATTKTTLDTPKFIYFHTKVVQPQNGKNPERQMGVRQNGKYLPLCRTPS